MGIPNENTRVVLSLWLTALLVPACGGCSSSSSNPDAGDGSTDTDSDTNTDSDSGTDTDADTDTDTNGCWWEQMESGTNADIPVIWGSSESEVFIIYTEPDSGEGVILNLNESSWETNWVFSNSNTLYIWGLSSDDIFLSIYNTVLLSGEMKHFDGADWSTVSGFTAGARSMWGFALNDIYAQSGGSLWHFNGSDWTVVWENPGGLEDDWGASIYAVWGSAPDDVFAVGVQGWDSTWEMMNYITHYDGVEFTEMPVEGVNSAALVDVYGVSANEVYAIGNNEAMPEYYENLSTVLKFNGGFWTPLGEFEDKDLRGVWASEDGEVFAAGRNVVLHYKDGVWEEMDLPVFTWLTDIWGTDVENLYAVGFYGVILKYTCPE